MLRKPVDLNSALQFSGLPTVAQLEMIEIAVRRVDKPVKVREAPPCPVPL
jgi:hypothetical protein